MIRDHADALEADLSRFHHIDLRDRFRFEHGRRVLTVRMILARVRHLPVDSAIGRLDLNGADPWTIGDLLLADLWQALTGSKKQHPLLRRTKAAIHKPSLKAQRARTAAQDRAKARREAIERGEIT